MKRLRASRRWISPSVRGKRRQTILTFVLAKAARVEFVIVRVAPDCRVVGRFRVKGRRGANRVRFRGRVGRRVLPSGTYRIQARTLPARGEALVDLTLVIVGKRKPRAGEIAAARTSNACAARQEATEEVGPFGFLATAGPGNGASSSSAARPALARKSTTPAAAAGRVLGAQFKKAADGIKTIPPLLFVALGFAIALLAIAAMPAWAAPSARMAEALEYRRSLIALGGATALFAVVVAYLLS